MKEMQKPGECGWQGGNVLEDYVVIDLEMTGLNVKQDKILETGAVRVRGGEATDVYSDLLRTGIRLTEEIEALTGITNEMAESGRDPEEAMTDFFAFLGDDVLVGQNIMFDYSFLKQWAVNHRFPFERTAADTLKLARKFLPKEEKKDLASLCIFFGIERRNAHRALDDAWETWQVFERLKERFGREAEESFVPKPLSYHVKRQTPATERQKAYLRRYAAHFGIAVPERLEEMTRSEVSRLVDQWIFVYGKLPEP